MNLGPNSVSSSNDLFLRVTQNLLGILVRDESARDELREQVGEIGLIMFVKYPSAEERRLTRHNRTLYESKGLEFDDVRSNKIVSRRGVHFLTFFFVKVLLYKFFEDSSVDLSQWRVVLNQLSEEENLDVPAPRFDDTRHAGVCSEVKISHSVHLST